MTRKETILQILKVIEGGMIILLLLILNVLSFLTLQALRALK